MRRKRPRRPPRPRPYYWDDRRVVFVDGEGVTRADGRHDYIYLAAVAEDGELVGELKSNSGLSSAECTRFLADLPDEQVFAFGFRYDLTKILEDVDDFTLYLLNHPDDRRRERHRGRLVRPEWWAEGACHLNLLQGRFDVEIPKRGRIPRRRTVVWDVIRYFQSSFVVALEDWQVGATRELAKIVAMKAKRGSFERESRADVQAYCRDECRLGAQLVRRLIQSMVDCGLKPRMFYSPGSVAEEFLKRWDVRKSLRPPPKKAWRAVAVAYVGGRFELGRRGPVRQPVRSADISSAYPYHLWQLPCLTCGRWELVRGRGLRRRIEAAKLACVRCRTPERPRTALSAAWGALPFRYLDGTTTYPVHNPGTWVWREEWRAARDLAGATCDAAWVYDSDCDCRPFAPIAEAYRYRYELGKDGRGKVYKLAINSCYGKLCQYRGSARFQSYVWAGNVTSGTRAQLYRLMATVADPRDVLMTATDGVLSVGDFAPEAPLDTGTSDLAKPLGGWELDTLERGCHLIRPGIYFPIEPSEKERRKVRSRGFGRAILMRHMPYVLERWEKSGAAELEFKDEVFWGMKSTVHDLGYELRRSDRYGRWSNTSPEHELVRRCDYSPLPKRAAALESGELVPWDRPVRMPRPCHGTRPGRSSAPYDPALSQRTRDALALQRARELDHEQPDPGGDVEVLPVLP